MILINQVERYCCLHLFLKVGNRLSDRIGSPLQKLQHFWSLNLLMLLDKILPPTIGTMNEM